MPSSANAAHCKHYRATVTTDISLFVTTNDPERSNTTVEIVAHIKYYDVRSL